MGSNWDHPNCELGSGGIDPIVGLGSNWDPTSLARAFAPTAICKSPQSSIRIAEANSVHISFRCYHESVTERKRDFQVRDPCPQETMCCECPSLERDRLLLLRSARVAFAGSRTLVCDLLCVHLRTPIHRQLPEVACSRWREKKERGRLLKTNVRRRAAALLISVPLNATNTPTNSASTTHP